MGFRPYALDFRLLEEFSPVVFDFGFFLQGVRSGTLNKIFLGLQHGLPGLFRIYIIVRLGTHIIHLDHKYSFITTDRSRYGFPGQKFIKRISYHFGLWADIWDIWRRKLKAVHMADWL